MFAQCREEEVTNMKAICELEPVLNKCPHFDPVEQECNSDNSCCGFYRTPAQKVFHSILGSHDGTTAL